MYTIEGALPFFPGVASVVAFVIAGSQEGRWNDGRRDMTRQGTKEVTLRDRLSRWAEGVRKQAFDLPPGPERDALLKKARQADTEAHLEDWANSPGLQPPK
jgi:hypothetical protein